LLYSNRKSQQQENKEKPSPSLNKREGFQKITPVLPELGQSFEKSTETTEQSFEMRG
jgi:hypothetical protein